MKTPYQRVRAFCKRNGICTICRARMADKPLFMCQVCRDKKAANKKPKRGGSKRRFTDEERVERRRDAMKRFKAKKQYELSRKRSQIRSAVEKGKKL